jgi:hypothetical protein
MSKDYDYFELIIFTAFLPFIEAEFVPLFRLGIKAIVRAYIYVKNLPKDFK